ncbi:uncharacterized protein LOC128207929 isoform X2 [Mya arenaria]|uniref:uncharacterized protein LOC128207929 isoform X2 n=1 Tax=Mya arenaria TaxID=6604 RepID=UPI0022DFBA82|nr:uncharacterized protein LOC128207929 isoform X2 [Mya arenaria]
MSSKQEIEGSSPKRSERLRSKRRLNEYEENPPIPPIISLDVLAHVATETLKQEPRSSETVSPSVLQANVPAYKKNSKRVPLLSLGQIQGLTEKTIVNLFTDTSENEYSRTFTFRCMLMPKQCIKEFTSYGSDMKAKNEVKKHLYQHLSELEREEMLGQPKFYAEPVQARHKRLCKEVTKKTTQKKSGKQAPESFMITVPRSEKLKKLKENYVNNLEKDETAVSSIGFIPMKKKLKDHFVSKDILKNLGMVNAKVPSPEQGKEEEENIPEEDIDVMDVDYLNHPELKDHCYTTVLGKRINSLEVINKLKVLEYADIDDERREKAWSIYDYPFVSKSITLLPDAVNKGKKPTPILFLRHRSPDENVPMVSREEIIDIESDDEKSEKIVIQSGVPITFNKTYFTQDVNLSHGEKPYPPMPKSGLAKKGRLGFDIVDMEDMSDDVLKGPKFNPLSREGREGNLGWEPALAMKYIRELRGRKKGENIALRCKICMDKTFTAAATLLYHYRSHAGFKPFVCLICNTTFTRQHSLNYHMLIHNNQSRFTCKDCGRKFRHPSHFKEHLRRHTGETPFSCTDCWQKFKTRNTYKRHLRTRHGKVLTATGIYSLSLEEFEKVRTKKYNVRQPDEQGQTTEEIHEHVIKEPSLPVENKKKSVQKESVKKAKSKKVDNSADDRMMILEELKADIKKEVGAENDSDPELSTILEALSQNCEEPGDISRAQQVKREPVEGMDGAAQINTFTGSEPVPSRIFVNQHMFMSETC